jgi:TRAP-type uncharacterized transport system substrate-binding protein
MNAPAPSGRWRLLLAEAGLPAVMALLVLMALALWGAWRALEPLPEKRLVIATGPDQGAYEAFGQRYRPLLASQGIAVTLRRTAGSAENLALLRDPASGVHAAFVQGGVAGESEPADDNLVSLGRVAHEPLWIFYRQDSLKRLRRGEVPERLSHFDGWRIDIGPAGGGTGLLLRRLAAESGLPESLLASNESVTALRVAALVQGRADALALVSAAEAPLVQYLLRTPELKLFAVSQAEAYARRFAFLQPLRLPRGVVDLAADQPPADMPLVAASASLLVQADLHPALMQLLLQAAQQAHGEGGWFQRRGEFPNPGADRFPLAAEAERHYRAGPPWLQRYLPFWLAHAVDRLWIVLLPLLAALLPLSRIVPPLITLRLRSRIYRWYAHLRAIEQALEAPSPDLPALRERLERLDAQTERIGVPLSFTGELYDLRAHIHLVRKRILAPRPGGAT